MAHIPMEVRRQQLVEAAMAVIARKGVDGATTRRIADEAGASLATLHYCFQAKENLLWAVFDHLAELVRNDIAQLSAPDPSTSVLAAHLVEGTVGWAIANPAANRAQIEIWLWAERNDSELAVRLYDTVIDAWKGLLRQARTPLADDEIESLTRVFLAIIDGLCMQLITHGDEQAVLRETQTAREMLMAYVGPS